MKKLLLILILIPSICFSMMKFICHERGFNFYKTESGCMLINGYNNAVYVPNRITSPEKFLQG